MQTGYKEKMIMHALYPRRSYASRTNAIKYLLFYACLFELAERGILKTDGSLVWCREASTGDPVLDRVIGLLIPLSGKRLIRIPLLAAGKISEIYRLQMKRMTENHYILEEDIVFISWKIGSRYRVIRYDVLKPDITKLERVLVYGRKPDPGLFPLLILAGEGNLYSNIFAGKEIRSRARKRYKQLIASDLFLRNPSYLHLKKSLVRTLNIQKAAKTY